MVTGMMSKTSRLVEIAMQVRIKNIKLDKQTNISLADGTIYLQSKEVLKHLELNVEMSN